MNEYSEHSNKYCCCGGHNAKNAKKKKSHNSTAKRLSIRKNREFKNKLRNDDA